MAKNAEAISSSWNKAFEEPVDDIELNEAAASAERELTFGQYLRRERVLRGISREEIIRVTKVSPEYYEALEGNKFDRLPPTPFVIGFLRVLAGYAGLDGDEVVNRYLGEATHQEEKSEIERQGLLHSKQTKKWLIIGGVVLLLLLMFAPLFR